MQPKPHVLLLENDLKWQERIIAALGAEGFRLDCAKTYAEAMDKLSAATYSLALVAVTPGEAGLEWVDMIRRLYQPMPVLFLAEADNAAQLYAGLDKPAFALSETDVLNKTADTDMLIARVREVLNRVIYLSAMLDADEGVALVIDQPYTLTVSTSHAVPGTKHYCALLRPVRESAFELEVAVQPFDIGVLSVAVQRITVAAADEFNPLRFQIVPRRSGRVEVVIDLRYEGKMMGRLILAVEVRGKQGNTVS